MEWLKSRNYEYSGPTTDTTHLGLFFFPSDYYPERWVRCHQESAWIRMESEDRRDKTYITGLCLWGVTDVRFTTSFNSDGGKKNSANLIESIMPGGDNLHLLQLLMAPFFTFYLDAGDSVVAGDESADLCCSLQTKWRRECQSNVIIFPWFVAGRPHGAVLDAFDMKKHKRGRALLLIT